MSALGSRDRGSEGSIKRRFRRGRGPEHTGDILKFDAQKGPLSFAAGARMDLLIFDLDGTLIDSKKDLVNAVNSTRAHMGMPPLGDETVASSIGNSPPVLIRRALDVEATEEEVKEATEFFIDVYREHALDFTRLYTGVRPS